MSLMATVMVLSALVAWGVAAWVRHRAEALRLVQLPNHRSSHVQPTPNGGGLGIVVAGSLGSRSTKESNVMICRIIMLSKHGAEVARFSPQVVMSLIIKVS